MNKVIAIIPAGALALTTLGEPVSSWAQSTANPQESQAAGPTRSSDVLEEVVVTAEKRVERLENVPASVQVVTRPGAALGSTRREYSGSRPDDSVARDDPGVRGPRGRRSDPRHRHSVVHAFGRRLGRHRAVDGISQGNLNISNLFDIQHVEVLEGPEGTLFGLTSSAGVINILTNAPEGLRL